MDNFQLYANYYDLLYADKDYEQEAAYVIRKLKQFGQNPSDLLELGCGSGNHAVHLTNAGLNVTGIERSASMVEKAKAKAIQHFEVLQADITDFGIGKKFDAVISLFHVVSYLTSNDDLSACFQKVNEHLNTDGIFLFDVWYTPAVYALKPETRIKRFGNKEVSITRLAESVMHHQKNVVDVNYEIMIKDNATGISHTLNETHPMRHFSIPEMELLATITGFQLLHTEEFLTGCPSSEDTWGICFILKKVREHTSYSS